MPLLSIDSSNGYSNVLITDDNSGKIYESVSDFHEKHSVLIFRQLDEAMRKTDIKLKDLTGIAVILGPGSYTGIRVSLTIAKTLSYVLGINIAGIGSLFACAYSLAKNGENYEYIIAAKKGIKDNYYVSEYTVENGNIIPHLKADLLNLNEIKSLAGDMPKKPALVYGYNKMDDYDNFKAEFESAYPLTPFDLKETTRFASIYAAENKADKGLKYTEELSPYYVYGAGPF